MRVVFVMRQLGYVRLFDAPIRALLERGHTIHLMYERDVWTERELEWLRELERHEGFSSSHTDALRRDRWFVLADRLRRLSDYVDFLGPETAGAPELVKQAEHRVHPVAFRRIVKTLSASETRRRALGRVLRALESVPPPSVAAREDLAALGAEMVAVVPHVAPGNRQSEYLRAAAAARLPSVVCVASWDNLTSRQLLRAIPDRLIVWNEVQKREAVERHHIPAERLVVTGVQSFDEWFERSPRPRDEFAALAGFDRSRPYLLWLGGALAPAGMTEAEFVRDVWLPRVRADERFAEVSLLVRPHPRRLSEWDDFAVDDSRVAVWPRTGAAMPVDEESRADFFDSMFHSAAVVGMNTTAMIEAAVVGRPVHTLLLPGFEAWHMATTHFHYLLDVGGGVLDAAHTWEEHLDSLARSVAGDDQTVERRREFLREFVRPFGLDQPALPRFVDALETTPLLPATRESPTVLAARAAFVGLLSGARTAVRSARAARAATR